jgi:kynurenine formamidase
VVLVALTLGAVSCGADAAISPPAAAPITDARFTRVSAYGVSAVVPHGWIAEPADDTTYTVGVAATPGPHTTIGDVPIEQGLIATRIDATAVGAPSDLYYLAAKGPILSTVHHDARCTVKEEQVYADHAPAAVTGRPSPGDFVATATGTCARRHTETKWSYFVAAPGFGPAREHGIPGSGLYVIVASTPAVPGASRTLAHMIGHVRFGDDGMQDFLTAVRPEI